MKVRNSRAALLSDYEVLSLANEMEAKLKEEGATAAAAEAEADGQFDSTINEGYDNDTNEEKHEQTAFKSIPYNLRAIQYKMREALGTTQRPCHHQTDASIPAFLDAISAWERGRNIVGLEERMSMNVIAKELRLTKGERLMLVNHAPTHPIVLYPLIEQIEDRFTAEEQQDLLSIIQLTLPLDTEAMRQHAELVAARVAEGGAATDEYVADDVDMGEEGYEEEALVEDFDELENEGRGEGAVDDEAKEEM